LLNIFVEIAKEILGGGLKPSLFPCSAVAGHNYMIHWNKLKYRFIKDVILVILILLHEKVVRFCLIVFLINSRFSKVEGGLSPPPPVPEEWDLCPQATPHFYSTAERCCFIQLLKVVHSVLDIASSAGNCVVLQRY
jgi:hypothetical protein